MIQMLRITPILFAVVACFAPGSSVAAEQAGERQDQQASGVFTGIHSKRGIGGRPNTVRMTDGNTFMDITEQEYRQRGYIPAFDKLPVLIIQRLPVRVPVPNEEHK
jgi:hypothetical protein